MKRLTLLPVALLLPQLVFAQNTLFAILLAILDIVLLLFPVAIGVATLVFFWGMAKFILNAGNERAREEGKYVMFWGLVALFVIVSIWGIVGFLGNVFGVDYGGSCPPPQIGPATVSTC